MHRNPLPDERTLLFPLSMVGKGAEALQRSHDQKIACPVKVKAIPSVYGETQKCLRHEWYGGHQTIQSHIDLQV